MKNIKLFTALFALLALLVNVNFGQDSNNEKVVMTNLIHSLDHNVDGVVEASIYNTIFLQEYFPDVNLHNVIKKLNEVAEDSNNPSIQFKAQLASLYLSNYGNDLKFEDYRTDKERVFQKIAQELESTLLVSKE